MQKIDNQMLIQSTNLNRQISALSKSPSQKYVSPFQISGVFNPKQWPIKVGENIMRGQSKPEVKTSKMPNAWENAKY